MKPPLCVIIAGPNGAGKTTFATDFLPRERRIHRFINADLIAAGLSPLAPNLANIAAARILLSEMDRLANASEDFGFETTLSGQAYIPRLKRWKEQGYRIEIIFLWLPAVSLAKARVRARVRQGGHNIPPKDIARRFIRGWENFQVIFSPLADTWSVFDNSTVPARLIEKSP